VGFFFFAAFEWTSIKWLYFFILCCGVLLLTEPHPQLMVGVVPVLAVALLAYLLLVPTAGRSVEDWVSVF